MDNEVKEYVSLKTAEALKIAGFKDRVRNRYNEYGVFSGIYITSKKDFNSGPKDWTSAPLLKDAAEWLRVKHGIFPEITVNQYGMYEWRVIDMNLASSSSSNGDLTSSYNEGRGSYSVYEEAMDDCIKAAAVLIKGGREG